MPYSRRGLLLEHWPPGDRIAWAAAFVAADPLDDPGLAAHWRAKTRHTVMTRYGLWLAHLQDSGRLDPAAAPAARATRANLAGFLAELRSRALASVTVAGYVRDLREAVRVMASAADLTILDQLLSRLEAVAEPSHLKRLAVVSPVLLLDAAIAEMTRQQKAQHRRSSRQTAERYRDALIIAFLATRPLRLANITAIELGKHLAKIDGVYWCRFAGSEMKEGQPLDFPMPTVLAPWLDRYLADHRPLLLRGTETPRLWISIRSTAMTDNTIHCRVCHVTKTLIGKKINPHLFRDCAATFIAEEAPDEVKIIALILGHSTLATSERYYNHARMLSAHKRYLGARAGLIAMPARNIR